MDIVYALVLIAIVAFVVKTRLAAPGDTEELYYHYARRGKR